MSEQKELLLPYIYYLKQNTPVDTEGKKKKKKWKKIIPTQSLSTGNLTLNYSDEFRK